MTNSDKIKLTKGCLIVFEGIDGTGKSTQLMMLAEALSQKCYDVVQTREPTNSVFGKKIRELYSNRGSVSREEELDLFLKDRKDHVDNLLGPSLASNKIVLCDRYYLSTIAYQGAVGMDLKDIKMKNNFAPDPDLALLFQLPPEISIKRITQDRGDSLNEFEQEDSLRKVENIFNSLAYPFIRHIDADRSIDAVHQTVISIVEEYLKDYKEN